jgi:ribonuclease Z
MKVTFLGTSGSFPTSGRSVAAHVVWVKGETLMLDCGENAQRQLRRSSHKFAVHRIFLSHLHLDHCLGLPGFLGTQNLLRRTEPLTVYCPTGTRTMVETLIGLSRPNGYPFELVELGDGDVVKGDGFRVTAMRVEHAGPCLGFRVEEDVRPGRVDVEKSKAAGIEPGPLLGQLIRDGKVEVNGRTILADAIVGPPRAGRCVVYSGDTRPCRNGVQLAKGADLLIHEATYTQELHAEAVDRAHSTAADAGAVARDARVKRLALTHVSQRHQEPDGLRTLLAEARAIFRDVFLPNDLDEVEIPHVE